MPKSVRIRAQYKQPFDQRKFIVALLAMARLELEAEQAATTKKAQRDG